MVDAFTNSAAAARALLDVDGLSEKEGQFCGGLAYRTAPLSAKQANWLRILLARHGLAPLVPGGEHD
jgi:hypothetical protein